MRRIIKKMDKPLLFITFLLFGFGLMMIFSASNVAAYMKYSVSPYRYFLRQLLFLVGSSFFSLILLQIDTKKYHALSNMALIMILLALIYLLLYAAVRNQAKSWIGVGFMTIQPSEFAKIAVIVYLATYYEKFKNKLNSFTASLFPLILPIAIAILIFRQPDLGTTIIFTLIVALIFFIVPISKEIKGKSTLLIGGFAICFALLYTRGGVSLLEDRQASRFDFRNPCSEEKFYGTGNQVCNGYIAINNGGLLGVGLGNSTQKYLYLPEAHTDFIFAIVLEETGLVGGLMIFGLYFLVIGRILKIGKESFTMRGAVICYAVAFYISLHIFVNLGGVFGLMPMTGVPLPFLSYGGSFAMCLIFALTFVQRIHVETKLTEEEMNSLKKQGRKLT